MIPIQTLRREHRLIMAVLEAAEREALHVARRGAFDVAVVGAFMDFFRGFAHTVHHAKEEHYLFVLLGRRLASTGNVDLVPLLRSHDECVRRLQGIADLLLPSIQGEYWTALSLSEQVGRYCEQMRSCIRNEETVVFPAAEALLSRTDADVLVKEFRNLSHQAGIDTLHNYRRIVRALARPARTASASARLPEPAGAYFW